jgi:hypothetical protein
MGCSTCPKPKKAENLDKHGNPISEAEKEELRRHTNVQREQNMAEEILNMSYTEYINRRKKWRDNTRAMGQEKIQSFSEDYKRIQIEELVSVYNLEEVHFKLTPDQALAALHEFIHNPVYSRVVDEFEGLREQVDKKYAELMSNRINIKWRP